MMEVNKLSDGRMLVCIRDRDGEVEIPQGNTTLQAGDKISVVIPMTQISSVLEKLRLSKKPIRSAMIAGGGNVTVYLANMLLRASMKVKIIEASKERCGELAELLPKADIIHGDSTNQQLLMEEGLPHAEAFVCLTGLDEENIMLALYAERVSKAKVISKVGRIDFEEVIDHLPLGSVVYPKNITAEMIVQYVRAMGNAHGNNVETLYRLLDGKVEAMEFVVRPEAKDIIGVPLRDLKLRNNLLICSITRKNTVITPSGNDCLMEGDVVIIVTTQTGMDDLMDIME